jgi:hypothetical protein
MIEQYLSNTNEYATIHILQKYFGSKQGLIIRNNRAREVPFITMHLP